ncbi:RNase MRP subunit [Emydomyces testavorans]|uniref:RNase MRP subunit n=1 Tax=Emydomyces testavorans TaxID=2070801 RepID=A0AAF0DP48_9EURO|nr:RNase MRP subunit [Emydomyces testavorans]
MQNPPSLIPAASPFFAIHDTLHLIYHHNKNQHRSAKWFKWLGILKRWTSKLAVGLQTAAAQSPVGVALDDDEAEDVRNMMVHVARDIVPKCYGAFSNTIADRQFSATGLVLLGLLAELASMIEMPQFETDHHSPALETGMSELDSLTAATASNGTRVAAIPGLEHDDHSKEDIGEVIGRSGVAGKKAIQPNAPISDTTRRKGKKRRLESEGDDDSKEDGPNSVPNFRQEVDQQIKLKESEKEKKKKKRKKSNAIDDIFGDLG